MYGSSYLPRQKRFNRQIIIKYFLHVLYIKHCLSICWEIKVQLTILQNCNLRIAIYQYCNLPGAILQSRKLQSCSTASHSNANCYSYLALLQLNCCLAVLQLIHVYLAILWVAVLQCCNLAKLSCSTATYCLVSL